MLTHSISAKPQQRSKNRRLLPLLTNFGKKLLPLQCRWFKRLFSIFLLWFSSHWPKQQFLFLQVFCQRSQKWRREAECLILVFGNGKNWQGSAQLSLLLPSPQPSGFCNDEKNSVIRSAMDALRNSQKISLLAVPFSFYSHFSIWFWVHLVCVYTVHYTEYIIVTVVL